MNEASAPLPLPPGFKWDTFDISKDAQLDEVCEFLNEHWLEDSMRRWGRKEPGNEFRQNFTKEVLRFKL